MHRHGYKGRKFGRERDQRRALMRSLSIALIEHGSIETTLPKAKELRPNFEKLVSRARRGSLHDRRQIVSSLASVTAAHRLVDQIAPAMKRTSGYLRIEKTRTRRGDNAPLARISFVDDINAPAVKPDAPKAKSEKPAPKSAKAPVKAKTEKSEKPEVKKTAAKGDK